MTTWVPGQAMAKESARREDPRDAANTRDDHLGTGASTGRGKRPPPTSTPA